MRQIIRALVLFVVAFAFTLPAIPATAKPHKAKISKQHQKQAKKKAPKKIHRESASVKKKKSGKKSTKKQMKHKVSSHSRKKLKRLAY